MGKGNPQPDSQAVLQADLSALFLVVPDGLGTRAKQASLEAGAGGGTLFYGSGTASNKVLKFLGLEDTRKEILMMLVHTKRVSDILAACDREMDLQKPGAGIAFAVPVFEAMGSRVVRRAVPAESECVKETGDMNKIMPYDVIFTVVERGLADDVVEASRAAGASGGTIITGRGTGVHETETFFGVAIEPEKEIILTLVPRDKASAIMENINRELRLNLPGKGIAFSLPVSHTSGIAHDPSKGAVT